MSIPSKRDLLQPGTALRVDYFPHAPSTFAKIKKVLRFALDDRIGGQYAFIQYGIFRQRLRYVRHFQNSLVTIYKYQRQVFSCLCTPKWLCKKKPRERFRFSISEGFSSYDSQYINCRNFLTKARYKIDNGRNFASLGTTCNEDHYEC